MVGRCTLARGMFMTDLPTKILRAVSAKSYTPIKPKVLFKHSIWVKCTTVSSARPCMRTIRSGRVALGRNNTLRARRDPGHPQRCLSPNPGRARLCPPARRGRPLQARSLRSRGQGADAATGDEVLLRVIRDATSTKDAAGEIVEVLERATRTFVGTSNAVARPLSGWMGPCSRTASL